MREKMDSVESGAMGPNPSSVGILLERMHGEPREVTRMRERVGGQQGYSGSRIGYYEVESRDARGMAHSDLVVTKDAVLHERRVLDLLSRKGCAVPPLVVEDLSFDGRSLVYMPFMASRPELDLGHPKSPMTLAVAEGLAGIHAANRLDRPEWMARTDDDFERYLWLRAWRQRWEENMANAEFRAEFGSYESRLEVASASFLGALRDISAEGQTLTVLNVDLLPDHIRTWRGGAYFIDWEQSSFGTLYLDLPNHFTVETALVYRDALARRGYEIPTVEFMERFHETSRYMGLRYLGASLMLWGQGGKAREDGRWFLHYTLHLALHGR